MSEHVSRRYCRVVYENRGKEMVVIGLPSNPHSYNFRIVSHFGARDWSPYGNLSDMQSRAATLPVRPDGFFKIVEG